MYLKFLKIERVDGLEDIGLHIEKNCLYEAWGGGFYIYHGQKYSLDDCCHFDYRKHLPVIK